MKNRESGKEVFNIIHMDSSKMDLLHKKPNEVNRQEQQYLTLISYQNETFFLISISLDHILIS